MTDLVLERFVEKFSVNPITKCWDWLASKDKHGYAKFSFGYDKWVFAHRFAYEVNKGKIPNGFVIDHLCRNPACVNPDHLEVVSQQENVLRGNSIQAFYARRTHCSNGHLLADTNLIMEVEKNGGTRRRCRICRNKEHVFYTVINNIRSTFLNPKSWLGF